MKTKFVFAGVLLAAVGALSLPASAMLPALDSQGAALPTLAPMIEKTSPPWSTSPPAVVSVCRITR